MFKIQNLNPFPLQGTNKRFIHLATVHSNLREFMCFIDLEEERMYVEEMTGGSLSFIDDENLASDLQDFLTEKGVLVIRPWNQIRKAIGYQKVTHG